MKIILAVFPIPRFLPRIKSRIFYGFWGVVVEEKQKEDRTLHTGTHSVSIHRCSQPYEHTQPLYLSQRVCCSICIFFPYYNFCLFTRVFFLFYGYGAAIKHAVLVSRSVFCFLPRRFLFYGFGAALRHAGASLKSRILLFRAGVFLFTVMEQRLGRRGGNKAQFLHFKQAFSILRLWSRNWACMGGI